MTGISDCEMESCGKKEIEQRGKKEKCNKKKRKLNYLEASQQWHQEQWLQQPNAERNRRKRNSLRSFLIFRLEMKEDLQAKLKTYFPTASRLVPHTQLSSTSSSSSSSSSSYYFSFCETLIYLSADSLQIKTAGNNHKVLHSRRI